MKDSEDIQDTIKRLRSERSALFQKGSQTGATWAKNKASLTELRLLNRLRSNEGKDWDAWFVEWDHFHLAAEILRLPSHRREVSETEFEAEESRVAQFWKDEVAIDTEADELASADFLQGFAEGALDVFEKVRGEL